MNDDAPPRVSDNCDGKTTREHVLQHVIDRFARYHTAVHFDTRLVTRRHVDPIMNMIENEIPVASVLFDTGALCANYISSSLFRELQPRIPERNIVKEKTTVGLADNKTVINSDTRVQLELDIVGDDERQVKRYTGWFIVIDMVENEMIIGLPAIISELWDFFKKSIETRMLKPSSVGAGDQQPDMADCLDMLCMLDTDTPDAPVVLEPWSYSIEEAPEELEVPLPTQFSEASCFLCRTREQAVREHEHFA